MGVTTQADTLGAGIRRSNLKIEETPLLFSDPLGHCWLRGYHVASFGQPGREQPEPRDRAGQKEMTSENKT